MPSSLPANTRTRLEALKRWLFAVTSGMGTSSPAEVLQNLVRILEGASPRLRLVIALATPWAMLAAALASYAKVWHTMHRIWSFTVGSIYTSVKIPGSHTLQKQVLQFVVEQGLGKSARTLMLSPAQRDPKQLMMNYMNPYDNIYGRERLQKQRHSEPEENEKPPLSYVPQVGSYVFWWRGNRITLRQEAKEYEERDTKGRYHYVLAPVADIELSCLSLFGGAGPLRDFLKFVQNIPTKERTTTIYRPQSTVWDAGIVQSSRNLNAVTMNSSIKDTLVRDVETYLAPATKKYYANRGIPYRRGYLFYGPPGTGKTSFANAIAGHFNLNVYMISLSTKTLSDDMLESLFEQLPNKCIVLLEDIDSAGIKRETMRQKRKKNKKQRREAAQEAVDQYGEPIYIAPSGITLSGLLNVLDGIHSREGMITIMTSNTPDSLDPALVRPGRIDRKVLFSYASKEVSAKLFRHIFEKTEEERVEGEDVGGEYDIAALSEQFAETIPAEKLTPGDVQGFLLVHRADPVGAVAEAAAWAEKTLEIKAKGANVAAFEGAADRTETSPGSSLSKENDERNDSGREDDTTSEDTAVSQNAPNAASMPDWARSTPFPSMPASMVMTGRMAPSGYPPVRGSRTGRPGHAAYSMSTAMPAPPLDLSQMTRAFASMARCGGSQFDAGVFGQPTPPYSRSASRSPPTNDRLSEKEEKEEAPQKASGAAPGKKGDDE